MILFVYGTRPEYIKIKPVMNEMTKLGLPYKQLFTGQHNNLVNCESDFSISICDSGLNRLDTIIQKCMNLPNEFFDGITYIMVQGDTTSVVGMSIAAMHRNIKIIHLEAGLRSYDKKNPFPEENNRRLVSSIADIHLCPTNYNKLCLFKENINKNVYVVGNTGLDNLIEYKKMCKYTDKVLVTIHRRENHKKIVEWFTCINNIAKNNPKIEFILPLHPNPNISSHRNILTHVNVTEPMEHKDLLSILIKTKLVITDSGGLQEECSFLNKKCLVCRLKTERPEAIGLSSVMISDPVALYEQFEKHINEYKISGKSQFGNGNSAKKVVKILSKL